MLSAAAMWHSGSFEKDLQVSVCGDHAHGV
jgi:hypothetical protein